MLKLYGRGGYRNTDSSRLPRPTPFPALFQALFMQRLTGCLCTASVGPSNHIGLMIEARLKMKRRWCLLQRSLVHVHFILCAAVQAGPLLLIGVQGLACDAIADAIFDSQELKDQALMHCSLCSVRVLPTAVTMQCCQTMTSVPQT